MLLLNFEDEQTLSVDDENTKNDDISILTPIWENLLTENPDYKKKGFTKNHYLATPKFIPESK